MCQSPLHIVFVADQTPRAKIFRQMVDNLLDSETTFETINGKTLQEVGLPAKRTICLLDLLNSEDSSFAVIDDIKKHAPGAAIIALHIYRSEQLISPLYEYGINGYIYSEPSRDELIKAIKTVAAGEIYRPDFLQDA